MADYKRMVSYMYQYENGVKKKNVGYARVEAKNGQFKVTMHMQLLGQLDSIFPIYLIQRDDNGTELIYLGDAVLKNQVMDSKLAAEEVNIMGSGYGLSDIGGIILFLNEGVLYATEWDDKPIIAKEIMQAMKPKQKNADQKTISSVQPVEAAQSKEKQEEGIPVRDKLEENNTLATEQGIDEQVINELFTAEQEATIPKYKLPRGWKTVEGFQREQSVLAADITELNTETKDSDQPMAEIDNRKVFNEDTNLEVDNTDIGNEEVRNKEIYPAEDNARKLNLNCPEGEEKAENPVAAHFFEHYPRMYPFEDNEITHCVKIEPKDIGYLPKDTWVLSNNSFLLHGFYCYHHLIFAKIKDRFGCRYILGIPGVYYNKEVFMARMFGFENFKSIRKRELKQGDFGYWYIQIVL